LETGLIIAYLFDINTLKDIFKTEWLDTRSTLGYSVHICWFTNWTSCVCISNQIYDKQACSHD